MHVPPLDYVGPNLHILKIGKDQESEEVSGFISQMRWHLEDKVEKRINGGHGGGLLVENWSWAGKRTEKEQFGLFIQQEHQLCSSSWISKTKLCRKPSAPKRGQQGFPERGPSKTFGELSAKKGAGQEEIPNRQSRGKKRITSSSNSVWTSQSQKADLEWRWLYTRKPHLNLHLGHLRLTKVTFRRWH